MPKVSFGSVCLAARDTYTPLEKSRKILRRVTLVLMPVLSNETLRDAKEVFDRVKVWRVRRQEL